MSLLTLIQDASAQLGLPVPSQVIGNTDKTVARMLSLLETGGKELRRDYLWAELEKIHSFDTASGTEAYAVPADFDRFAHGTHWDATNFWSLRGPVTPQHWEGRKRGITQVTPRKEIRVYGASDTEYHIHPTPDSTDTLYFEYYSKNWIRPVTWTASASFLAGAYCSYNGNIYYTEAGGTTDSDSANAPVHTSDPAVSDGGVTWAYYTGVYERFTADNDEIVIDEHTAMLDLKWRWRHANALEFQTYKIEAARQAALAVTRKKGAPKLSISGARRPVLLTASSIPESGFGS